MSTRAAVRVLVLCVLAAVTFPAGARAGTVTLDFDAPDFLTGALSAVGDINFLPAATVFTPSHVSTFSGTQALRVNGVCTTAACTNGAYRMVIRFGQPLPGTNGWLNTPADSVSMRIGADTINTSCFPEGTSCAIWARLTGYDAQGGIVADSQDVFLLDALSNPTPITHDIHIDDPYGRITGAILVYGKDTFSHDATPLLPGEPQIDHLVVHFPDTPPSPPPTQPAPTVSITAPLGGSYRHYPYQTQLRGSVTVPAGLAAFCYRVNGAAGPIPLFDCHNNGDLRPDRTFDISVPDDALRPSNTLTVTVYDLSGRAGTGTVTFTALAPPPPRVTFALPTDFQWLSASSPTYVSGSVATLGLLQGFCILVDPAAAPAPGACTTDLSAVHPTAPIIQPLGFSTSLAPQRFGPGARTLSAFAVDRWNQVGRADLTVNLPTDFRVVGMEVTQAIQTPAIPLNFTGSTPYSGVRLRQRVPTVVRVFANTPNPGGYCCPSMLLSGFVPDPHTGERALGSILPDSRPNLITTGPLDVPLAMRADPGGGYVFTLPADWTLENGLRLTASLTVPFPLQECPTCGGNNTFSVTGINFEPPAQLVISPMALTWSVPGGPVMAPPASTVSVFAPMVNISPLPSSQVTVYPYVATIDVSDLVGSGGSCGLRSTCEGAIFGRVTQFEITDHPGYTIGVGPVDVGVAHPATINRPFYVGLEQIAVADTSQAFRRVAHEFYHELAFYHASPGCGADLYNLWPPDQQGYIHGVGLDRRKWHDSNGHWNGQYRILAPGTAGLPGGQANYWDLMAYCGNESLMWISVENWNNFGGAWPNGVIPDSVFLGNASATVMMSGSGWQEEESTEAAGGALVASAVVDPDGSVTNFRVFGAGDRMSARPPDSPYAFLVRDSRGAPLAEVRAHAFPVPGRGERESMYVTASLPAQDAASIAVEREGEVVGVLERSPSAPEVRLEEPTRGAVVSRDGELTVAWTARDADDDALEVRIEYAPDRQQPFRPVYGGPNRGRATVPAYMLEASEKGRVRIVVSDGFNETAAIVEPIDVERAPPLLEIAGPEPDSIFPATTPIRLQASAFGNDRQPLAAERIQWFVDDVEAGTGTEVEVRSLERGEHVARVIARDGELSNEREVRFRVE